MEKRGKEIIYTPDTSILHKQSRTIVVKHIPTHPKETEINRETPIERETERETETDREREREGISDIFPDCKRGALRYGRNRSITRARHTIPNPEIGVTDTKRRIPKRTMSNGVRVCVCVCACNAESLTFSSLFAVRLYYMYIYVISARVRGIG